MKINNLLRGGLIKKADSAFEGRLYLFGLCGSISLFRDLRLSQREPFN